MARRWTDPAAFRADPAAAPALRPSRRQTTALVAILLLVAGAVTAASYLIKPDDARSFDLFHGSLFLADTVAPVAVDLASGKPTVRLVDANTQVGARNAGDLAVTPMTSGTLLLNRTTGEFNMVDATGFVMKTNGGVKLPARAGSTGAVGIASKDGSYIAQTGPTGTDVYLVGPATVQSAAGIDAKVKPRASVKLTEPAGLAPGSAVSAGNDLWLLTGTGTTRTIRHLRLPPRSSAGATLRSASAGTVSGPAAVAVAGSNPDDQSVAVASDDRMQIFHDGSTKTLRWTTPPGVDTVLAATEGTDRFSFLMHGSTGWSLVSAAADGSDVRGPKRLPELAVGARLVPPAASNGWLFTMDTVSGQLIRIDAKGAVSGLTGTATYPLTTQNGRVIESGDFGDAYVIARGSRVVVNSPSHLRAVVVFTDGSRDPLTIEKSSAVTVNAAGGAQALTQGRAGTKPDTTAPGQPKPTQKPASPVNNKIDCTTTSQKPHIPELGQPVPGSRSVLLTWTYPVINQTDCVPRTYTVGVKLLSNSAPQPPAQIQVDSQQSVNLSGLFPSTRYEITVTAYINSKGTSSEPIQITTGPEGPASPRDVSVVTDSSGNWNLKWSACGSVSSGCIPSASWRVIPQFCDGLGLSGPPSPIDVTADPTSIVQPGAQLKGNDALLGRGVRFQIEGTGENGAVGKPSAATPCTFSWSPPVGTAMRLTASTPNNTEVNGTSSTTLNLSLGSDAVRNAGGVGAQITFRLAGPNGTQTRGPFTFDGRDTTLTTSFGGVRAGGIYRASAVVSPRGHPGDSTGLGPIPVTTSNNWPALTATAASSCGLLTCNVRVNITGIASSQVGGERFDLTSDSILRCGEVATSLGDYQNFDPAATTISTSVSQLNKFFGPCKVTVGLVESRGDASPLYFGGAPSPTRIINLSLGQPATASADEKSFDVGWVATNGSSAEIRYTGNEDLGALTTDWNETVRAPDNTVCGIGGTQPGKTNGSAAYVAISTDCINRFGSFNSGWSVSISYHNATDGGAHGPYQVTLDGAPPSYLPCNPAGPSATWGPTRASGVTVRMGGDLGGCSNWTYQLLLPSGAICTGSGDAPSQAPTVVIPINCGDAATGEWRVTITWTKPNGDIVHNNPTTAVLGAPPP